MTQKLLTRFLLFSQQGAFLSFDLVILKSQVGDVVVERHNLGFHAPLIIDDFTVFIFVVSGELVEFRVKLLLGRHENSVAITDLSNLSKFIIALVLDVLQEVLILLHGGLLLLYASLFGFEDGNLLPLAVNLSFD